MGGFVAQYYKANRNLLMKTLLMTPHFRFPCAAHRRFRSSNQRNGFCTNCNKCICEHCAYSVHHRDHHCFRIYTHRHQNVVRLQDFDQLRYNYKDVEIVTNKAKKRVKYLKRSDVIKRNRVDDNWCKYCSRGLLRDDLYCSLICKWKDKVYYTGDAA